MIEKTITEQDDLIQINTKTQTFSHKLEKINRPLFPNVDLPKIDDNPSLPISQENILENRKFQPAVIFQTYYHIRRFVAVLKYSISSYFFNKNGLNSNALNMINDLGANNAEYLKLKKFMKSKRKKTQNHSEFFLWKIFYLIKFNSIFNTIWKLFSALFILLNVLMVPVDLTFHDENQNSVKSFKIFLLVWFFCDFLKKCNTQIQKKDETLCSRSNSHCLKTFIYDLMAFIPLISNIAHRGLWSWFLNLLFYPKMKEMFKTLKHFFCISRTNHYFCLQIFKICSIYGITIHILACFWIYLLRGLNNPTSWFNRYELSDEKWSMQYVLAFKFILQMFSFQSQSADDSKGFEEVLFTILFIIISFVLLFMVMKIFFRFLLLQKDKNVSLSRIQIINDYLSEWDLKQELKEKMIKEATEIIQIKLENEKKLLQSYYLENLPIELKDEFNGYVTSTFFENILLFQSFSPETLGKAKLFLKNTLLSKGDAIYQKNSNDEDNALHFITKGEVSFYSEGKNFVYKKKKGEIFGEEEFFSGFESKFTAIASEKTSIISLKQSDFLNILKEERNDYEKFCEIRDQINLESNFKDLKNKCGCCGDASHRETVCPMIHFISKSKKKSQKTFLFDPKQKRSDFIRNKKKRKTKKLVNNNINFENDISMNDFEENESFLNSDVPLLEKDFFGVKKFDVLKSNTNSRYFPEHNVEFVVMNANKKRKKIEELLKISHNIFKEPDFNNKFQNN